MKFSVCPKRFRMYFPLGSPGSKETEQRGQSDLRWQDINLMHRDLLWLYKLIKIGYIDQIHGVTD